MRYDWTSKSSVVNKELEKQRENMKRVGGPAYDGQDDGLGWTPDAPYDPNYNSWDASHDYEWEVRRDPRNADVGVVVPDIYDTVNYSASGDTEFWNNTAVGHSDSEGNFHMFEPNVELAEKDPLYAAYIRHIARELGRSDDYGDFGLPEELSHAAVAARMNELGNAIGEKIQGEGEINKMSLNDVIGPSVANNKFATAVANPKSSIIVPKEQMVDRYNNNVYKQMVDWEKSRYDRTEEDEIIRKLNNTRTTQERQILEDQLKRLRDNKDWAMRNQYIVLPDGGGVVDRESGQYIVAPTTATAPAYTVLKPDEMLVGADGQEITTNRKSIVVGADETAYVGDARYEGYRKPNVLGEGEIVVGPDGQEIAANRREVQGAEGVAFVRGKDGKFYPVDKQMATGYGFTVGSVTGEINRDTEDAVKETERIKAENTNKPRFQLLPNGVWDNVTGKFTTIDSLRKEYAEKIVNLEEMASLSKNGSDREYYQKQVEELKAKLAKIDQEFAAAVQSASSPTTPVVTPKEVQEEVIVEEPKGNNSNGITVWQPGM